MDEELVDHEFEKVEQAAFKKAAKRNQKEAKTTGKPVAFKPLKDDEQRERAKREKRLRANEREKRARLGEKKDVDMTVDAAEASATPAEWPF